MSDSFFPPQGVPRHEQATDPRFSLALESIGSRDFYTYHPAGRVRGVMYEHGDASRMGLREALLEQGLILGKLKTDWHSATQVFTIPASARPLAYDAESSEQGYFSYTDQQLFGDIGDLLARVSLIDDEQPRVSGLEPIGRTLALVEFPRVGERRIFLVPGIEELLEPANPEMPNINYYGLLLEDEFGDRFLRNQQYFIDNFNQAISET